MLICNYEGDELLMQVLTAITKREYYIKLDSGGTKKLGKEYYRNGRFSHTAVKERLDRLGKGYTVELMTICDDFNNATYLINQEVKKIYNITKCDRIDFHIGPSDGSNFRFKSAVQQPYKGKRAEKPALHAKLREYLITVHGAQVIQGYEADDALGIYQTQDTIACHCDKDICMIPGKHFNTMTNEFYTVEDPGTLTLSEDNKTLKGTGLAFFYAQLLMGDRTDNIPAIKHPTYKGWGAKTTYEALKSCTNEYEYLDTVSRKYCDNDLFSWRERLYEQADLVWICRELGVTGSKYLGGRI
ncbi:exonuclease [uncultured Caudovirales phage]|uniref:Exonuclease n=1 Tax=uncultured Caudovirales phage TaxID=2100421 RepID=A0A6J5KL28_9CAUD|nr:exonuclease [uncultured Caudovirales phage]